ncbi:hypothetical protein AB0B31_15100 [Catellatospora citrea]
MTLAGRNRQIERRLPLDPTALLMIISGLDSLDERGQLTRAKKRP